MQKLQQTLEVRGTGIPGLKATLVERTDKKAIYLRSDDVYEVFYVQVSPEEMQFGKLYPERETYPSNEDFGKMAWTYTTPEGAHHRYIKM